MKKYAALFLLLLSGSLLADNLRDLCENAYYANAGGVTELHQYKAIVDFGVMSDSLLVQAEDLLFGEGPLKAINETSFVSKLSGKTLYVITLKEINGFDQVDFIDSLNRLQKIPGVSLSCK